MAATSRLYVADDVGWIKRTDAASSVEMLIRLLCSCALLVLGLSLASAQPTQDLAQELSRISASVINGPSTELLRQLTDDIGARLADRPLTTGLRNGLQHDFGRLGSRTFASRILRCRMAGNVARHTRESLRLSLGRCESAQWAGDHRLHRGAFAVT